jgi:hypothetical protein
VADPRDRHLQTNAADPRQRKYADRVTKHDDAQLLAYVKAVLATEAGRAVLWHLMYEARTALAHATEDLPQLTASVWDNSAVIHYHSGRQDMGLLIQGLIRRAEPDALGLMLKEAMDADKYRARQNVASRMEHATP